jgi:hypothetical protein
MRSRVGKFRVALSLLSSLLLLHGCAMAPPAETKEETSPGYTIRFPGADPMELEARTPAPTVQPELPPTDADERKGRWLRVIEVERNPRHPDPAPGEHSPPAPPPPVN